MCKIIVCLLLLTAGITNARKFSVGGKGSSRGSSAARMNVKSGQHPQQSGHYPQQIGRYPQQSNYHPHQNGYHQPAPGGYHPNQVGGYHQQSGVAPSQMKPSNKGAFGTALAGGLVGGVAGGVIFHIGKAVLTSKSEPLTIPNGQNYYFDERNYQLKNGYFICSMLIDDVVKMLQENSTNPTPAINESTNSTAMTPAQFFKTVQFSDGSRPKSLTWDCKTGSEVCCGIDCCPAQLLTKQKDKGNHGHHGFGGPSWVVFARFVDILKFK
ncbi:unnamed protein product [Cercopithifilaria johnstoni]|uniref:CX domain-containing protein n=1 Tax=Cercopithifilaria johnstoni TaxID=2874296 RepID=A0A8J2LVH2_9BILA|nr:unnamed protein product [Cercopithifilaria johnstoni]